MLGIATAVSLLGCGGDGGDSGAGSCDVVSACGGAIEGDWTVVSFCPDKDKIPKAVTDICEAATLDSDALVVSGEISFKGDKTFVQSSRVKGTGYMVLERSCLEQGSVTLMCSQIEELINRGSDVDPVTCESSGGGCRCALAIDQSAQDEGTYSVSGTTLTMMSDASGTFSGGYCVQDSALTVDLDIAAMDGDDSYDLAGQLKLEKQ